MQAKLAPINLAYLLDAPPARFIHDAFHDILGREPDDEGLIHYAARLQNGAMRLLVLIEMRNSAEGRASSKQRPCFPLDRAVSLYRVVRPLPLGRLRWALLPSFGARTRLTDKKYPWLIWAQGELATRNSAKPAAPPENHTRATTEEALQPQLDRIASAIRTAALSLQSAGASPQVTQELLASQQALGLTTQNTESTSWGARQTLHVLSRATRR